MSPRVLTRPRRTALAVVALLLAGSPSVAAPAVDAPAAEAACASEHLAFHWKGLPAPLRDGALPQFYYAEEGATASMTIRAVETGPGCEMPAATGPASYEIGEYPGGTAHRATAGDDFAPQTGATPPLSDHRGPNPSEHSFQAATLRGLPLPAEAVAEKARARITGGGHLLPPHDLPLYVVDADGLSRVAMERDGPVTRSETYPTVSLAVFRAGKANAEESFPFAVTGTSADPATPGADFRIATPSPLRFRAGERVGLITVEIVNDRRAEPAEELAVTLTEPGPTIEGEPVATRVRILDNEESVRPRTWFHHPRHAHTYAPGDYRLREFHIFATDRGGSGVASVRLAVRRIRTNGRCQWFTGRGWANGGCAAKRWLKAPYDRSVDWYYYRMPALKPSVGTDVRSYAAYARATDGSGNVERSLIAGRNANRFEVRRRRR